MKRLTRTVQRTPNLGLTLKMQKPASTCCEPEIGPARWRNPATGEYDTDTLIVFWQNYYGAWASMDIGEDAGMPVDMLVARVTGDLCESRVEWSVRVDWADVETAV